MQDLVVGCMRVVVPDARVVLDLGTATGAILARLALEWGGASGAELIGVDCAEEMLKVAVGRLAHVGNVYLVEGDLRSWAVPSYDVAVLFLTLSFIPPSERVALLTRLHLSMGDGGAVFLADKARVVDPIVQKFLDAEHEDFKRRAGLADEEIAAKRRSLVGVQYPVTVGEYEAACRRAGFLTFTVLYQDLNFFCAVVQ